jgi:23S rRNA pseudouridine1911/1915/1917 synthase
MQPLSEEDDDAPDATEPTVDLVIPPDAAGQRLDRALAAAAEGMALSRSRIGQLIAAGALTGPDGATVAEPARKVKAGERYRLAVPPPADPEPRPEPIPLAIACEDEHLIVVDKPAGMVVHPAPGAETGTLVNALLAHCGESLKGIGGTRRPGIVHRIDKDTSGLVVVAKTEAAHAGLAAQFAAHTVERRYLAVLWGAPDRADPRLAGLPGVGWGPDGWIRIEAAIGRHRTDRKRMAVSSAGRRAVTRLRVLERFGAAQRPVASLVECRLETGRTHQIRVHASHIGHPLIGDPVYGRARPPAVSACPEELRSLLLGFPRQALHAATLGFVHPETQTRFNLCATIPPDLHDLLMALRRNLWKDRPIL